MHRNSTSYRAKVLHLRSIVLLYFRAQGIKVSNNELRNVSGQRETGEREVREYDDYLLYLLKSFVVNENKEGE